MEVATKRRSGAEARRFFEPLFGPAKAVPLLQSRLRSFSMVASTLQQWFQDRVTHDLRQPEVRAAHIDAVGSVGIFEK
jgi:hypothetical protein